MTKVGLSETDKKQLTVWIGGTNKEYKLLYKATQHGLSAAKFHECCDNKGPTVTVAYTYSTGYTFGGYTGVTFNSTSAAIISSSNTFLFRLQQASKVSYEKYPGKNGGIYCAADYGPTFGNGAQFELVCFTKGPHNFKSNVNDRYDCKTIGFKSSIGTYGAFDNRGHGDNALQGSQISDFADFEVYQVTDVEGTRSEWRKMKLGWAKEAKEELVREISSYRLPECVKVPEVRILLIGQIGAGKSSFYNSISSIYRGYPTFNAAAGSTTHSVTTMYRTYSISNERYGQIGVPRVRLCDTMGLENDHGLDVDDIVHLIDGNVQDCFQFNTDAKLDQKHKELKQHAKMKDRIQVIAFVVDGSNAELLSPTMMEKMKGIRQEAQQRGVPVAILLTKIDKICSHVMDSVSNVYISSSVYRAVETVAEKFGIPKAQVFPVKNYEDESELHIPADILALTALKHLLRLADSYIDDVFERFSF